ncbi:UNVERIFIED_CONTAM: hypothetical protein Cloal_0449 [Acetivibrio alkalicellulosi]
MEEYEFKKNNTYSISNIGNPNKNKYVKASLVLSIIGVILISIFGLFLFLGLEHIYWSFTISIIYIDIIIALFLVLIFLFQVLGLIFGIKGLSSEKRRLAKKGILLSIVAVFLEILVILMLKHFINNLGLFHYTRLSTLWIILSPIFGLFLFQVLGFIFGINNLSSEKKKLSIRGILVSTISLVTGIAIVLILMHLNYQTSIIARTRSAVSCDYINLSRIGIIVSPIFLIFLFQALRFIFVVNSLSYEKKKLSKKVILSITAVFLGISVILIFIGLEHKLEQRRISQDHYIALEIEHAIIDYMIYNISDLIGYEEEITAEMLDLVSRIAENRLKDISIETLDVEKILTDLSNIRDNNKGYLSKEKHVLFYPASRLYNGWNIFIDIENVRVEVEPSPEGHSIVVK